MSAQPQQNKKNKKDERGGRGRGKERRRNRMHVMAGVHRGVGLGLSLVSPGLKSFLVGMGGGGVLPAEHRSLATLRTHTNTYLRC